MLEKIEKSIRDWPETLPLQLTQTLDAFLNSGTSMPQAYLFIGSSASESNSRNLVETFAAKITQSQKVTDTVLFDAADGSGIEGIREVMGLAALMPVASNHKVVIMANMDQASPQMLNALLKTLEEPPAHTIFLLISSRPVLATIMSRCQVFSVQSSQSKVGAPAEAPSEINTEITEALNLLIANQSAGLAERLVLVNKLAAMEDEILPKVIEVWLHRQIAELKNAPHKYAAVRVTMETLSALQRSFNKKMVLQQFVTSGLI